MDGELRAAAKGGDAKAVRRFVLQGANIDSANFDGWTALHSVQLSPSPSHWKRRRHGFRPLATGGGRWWGSFWPPAPATIPKTTTAAFLSTGFS